MRCGISEISIWRNNQSNFILGDVNMTKKKKKEPKIENETVRCPACRMWFEIEIDVRHPDLKKIGPCPYCKSNEWWDEY